MSIDIPTFSKKFYLIKKNIIYTLMQTNKPEFQKIGQFFTEKNIFICEAFKKWWKLIPLKDKHEIVEPFAGRNGLIDMIKGIPYIQKRTIYSSFDIIPGHSDVEEKDTLLDFPKGFKVGITNPPFLAKNSATRNNIDIEIEPYSDLYELCLKKCLDNLDYLAVIIPESFITSAYFKDRLFAVISLTEKRIFKTTEQPVCLALFVKNVTNNYLIYKNELLLGSYKSLLKKEQKILKKSEIKEKKYAIIYHRKDGQIGFLATDSTSSFRKMRMVLPSEVPDEEVNNIARLRLRILINKGGEMYKVDSEFIEEFNKYLNNYRTQTSDVFLTSFKGLRDDGFYRRRMSFSKLKLLLLNFLYEYEK